MNILHINTFDQGGAAIGASRIHKALLDIGLDSNILFYRKTSVYTPKSNNFKIAYPNFRDRILKRFGINLNSYEKEGKTISKLGKPFSNGGTFELFSSPYGPEESLHNHPLVKEADIINLHWVSGFVDLPSFIKNLSKPIVWTLHDMNPFLGGFHYDIDLTNNPSFLELENRYKNIKKDIFINKKYAIIGNSNWTTQCALESSQFENALSINSVYYPLDINTFDAVDKKIAKTCLGLPLDKLIIGFACENLENPRKGFDTLLNALSQLDNEHKKRIYCLTFGKYSDKKNSVDGIDFLNLGNIENSRIQSIAYSAMDFFIIPSVAEAFGLTSLEAMSCKTPIIGSNIGGIPEMVINDFSGFLFETSNSESLKKNILKALETNFEKRQQMGEQARSIVISNHNPTNIAKIYFELYNLLLNGESPK